MRTSLNHGGVDLHKQTKPVGVVVVERRHRRTRLKRAMQPIIERFGCTQMEAAGRVENLFYLEKAYPALKDENDKLGKELTKLDKKFHELNDALEAQIHENILLDQELTALKTQLDNLQQNDK